MPAISPRSLPSTRWALRRAALILTVAVLFCSTAGAAPLASTAAPDQTPLIPALPDLGALPPEALAKIDPALLDELVALEESAAALPQPNAATRDPASAVTYLVELEDEAPLGAMPLPHERDARREAVVARLKERAQRSQRRALGLLADAQAAGAAAGYRSYWIANVLAVEGRLEPAIALALLPEVVAIEPNRTITLSLPEVNAVPQATSGLAWGVDKIDAERVWAEWGITGRGIVVANMDSGVDWTHPALQRKYRGYNPDNPLGSNHNYNWFDFTSTYPDAPGPSRPIARVYVPLVAGYRTTAASVTGQSNGPSPYPHWQIKDHGTHVMGTMVGSSSDGSAVVGVAPGAQWIAVKVFDDTGKASDEAILAGFQWLLAPTDLRGKNPDPSKGPDVVCSSWGEQDGANTSYLDSVAMLRAAGIITVFSAGNQGPNERTINAPASYTVTLAIGATDSNDDAARFSSRGPSSWSQTKPDVVAPGVAIPSTIPGGTYAEISGTSVAAPHAAGAIALMLQADRQVLGMPTLTITTTEGILRDTAIDLGEPGPDNTYGYGRIDAYAAVKAVRDRHRFILPMVFRRAPMVAP